MIVFWHPTLDGPISSTHFDWGNTPQASSADRSFRLKNTSATETALSVTVAAVSGYFLVSKDDILFEASFTLGDSLSPDELTDVLTVRRNLPADAGLAAGSSDLTATPTGFADNGAATAVETMTYTVTDGFPVPHIWFITPDEMGASSGSFQIVGRGFGAEQRLSRLWWARGTDQQRIMEVIDWHREEATYADGGERRIDASDLENTNVGHDLIRTDVPTEQPFGIYDVVVETDDTDVAETPDIDGGTSSPTFDDNLDGGRATSVLTANVNGRGA